MSCNGCRVLRKGCSREECMLRDSLMWIGGKAEAEAEANATACVAKFFGRATLMSFLSSVPQNQRSSLFESLLYEAVGRRINPVSGAVGLLWTGNWKLCQMGVDKLLMRSSTTANANHDAPLLGSTVFYQEVPPPPPPPAPSNSNSRIINNYEAVVAKPEPAADDDRVVFVDDVGGPTHDDDDDDHTQKRNHLLTLFF